MNPRFLCHYEGCGRSFQKEADYKNHLKRRHMESVSEEKKEEVNDLQEQIRERLFGKKRTKQTDIEVNTLSNELLLDASGQDALDDITELILRSKGLKEFVSNDDIDLDDLTSLEYLCLSHNSIINIEGVSQLLGLRELNLNNNSISDITPLEPLAQLTKLFCANNQIKVVLPLKSLKQLTEISIYNNKLFDLEQSLKVFRELPKLKSLEIERNPCVLQTQNCRYKILHMLKLESLDGELVTDVDEQITYNIFGERELYVPKNLIGKLRANAQVNGNVERELLYEEIEALKEELSQVTAERDKLAQDKEKLDKESVGNLKDENLRLRREVGSMYALLDEVNDLRAKLREGLGAYASEIYEENYRLRARVIELENKQKEENIIRRPHTAAVRPVTASVKEVTSDEIYEFIEKNNRMLINLDKKVHAYKDDLKKYNK